VLKYKSAGTVEFLVDDITGDYFFLEMNTRIQVEHPITEMCYGVDLVALMLRQADFEKGGCSGIPSPDLLKYRGIEPHGAAIEVRVYAENPYRGFCPAPGLLQDVSWAAGEGVRIDTWVKTGQTVTPYYDPLVAKVITHASDRPKCLAKMSQVLSRSKAQGPPTSIDFLRSLITSEPFEAGNTLTNFLPKAFTYNPCAIDVIIPGAFTTVQDYPARPGMGHGVPQCGPMDSVSFRSKYYD
jgi:acetyl/propionyl-CoA carboxylase alpha subunit